MMDMMSWKPRLLAQTRVTELYLELARVENRVLITIDTDFGELIYLHDVPHSGLIRLPDVPAEQRIALVSEIIRSHYRVLEEHAIVTVRGGRVRISDSPVL